MMMSDAEERGSLLQSECECDKTQNSSTAAGRRPFYRQWIGYGVSSLRTRTIECVCGLPLAVLLLGISMVAQIYCKECHIAVIVLCSCFCCGLPLLNIPLYLSVLFMCFNLMQQRMRLVFD